MLRDLYVALDQPVERLVGLEAIFVGGLAWIHAHAFIALQILKERAAQIGIGVEQGGARELDHGDELQGHALRARLALDHAKALEPRRQTDGDEQRDQREGSPEQAAERERQ